MSIGFGKRWLLTIGAAFPLGLLAWLALFPIASLFPNAGWVIFPARVLEVFWMMFNLPPHGEARLFLLGICVAMECYLAGLLVAWVAVKKATRSRKKDDCK